jgi:hypothetical protein
VFKRLAAADAAVQRLAGGGAEGRQPLGLQAVAARAGDGGGRAAATRRIGTPAPASTGPGGAMPYARSLRRPSSLIQSVVQAGARCIVMVTGPRPAAVMASTTLWLMTSVAGQPE